MPKIKYKFLAAIRLPSNRRYYEHNPAIAASKTRQEVIQNGELYPDILDYFVVNNTPRNDGFSINQADEFQLISLLVNRQ